LTIAKQSAVGVAIESDPKIVGTLGGGDVAGHVLRMQRSATLIDVLPVRGGVDKTGLNATGAKQFRRFGGGGAVRTIHQHTQIA